MIIIIIIIIIEAPPQCCDSLTLSGLKLSAFDGTYSKEQTSATSHRLLNGRTVYLHSDKQKAIWHFGSSGSDSYWIIGPAMNMDNPVNHNNVNYSHSYCICLSRDDFRVGDSQMWILHVRVTRQFGKNSTSPSRFLFKCQCLCRAMRGKQIAWAVILGVTTTRTHVRNTRTTITVP